ncbi:MAG: transcription antitermination factor NusB [Flavobacteriales bacterium]|jgi:N utilization substance protein B
MFNRRHLRIKVLHCFYAYFQDDDKDLNHADKQLKTSLDKMYEMYVWLLSLVVEMQDHAIDKIEAGRNKKLPSPEDLHPNTKFVTNSFIRLLANSKVLNNKCEELAVNWSQERDLSKKIFKELIQTEDYKEYMESSERGFSHDKEFLLRFFKRHMINVELLHDFFEERSVLWTDDLDLAAGMAIKTIKAISDDDADVELLPLWRDPEDEKNFLNNLFKKTLSLGEESEKLIAEAAKNWDFDRIALLDQILMKMAIAEAQTFKDIPLKVTLNEYIELSKYYSTPKSAGFINGVLDQIFDKLKEDGKIKKTGKGLLE